MREKDHTLLEEAYSKVIRENIYSDGDFDYPPDVIRAAERLGVHPEKLWRQGADDDYEPPTPKFKERSEGDEFTDNRGIKRIMIRMQDGKLIPAEKVFTSKKDGKQWERYKRPNGTIGVKPFTPEPKPEPKPNSFRTEWGSPNANPEWD